MVEHLRRLGRFYLAGTLVLCLAVCGCGPMSHTLAPSAGDLANEVYFDDPTGVNVQYVDGEPTGVSLPNRPGREKQMVSLPAYTIGPPDVLLINAIRMAPKAPYAIQSLDILQIVVNGTPPDQPISGNYQVEPNGTVNLGPAYGSVKAGGLSIDELNHEISRQLRRVLQAPEISVSLLQSSGQQQVVGEHLVGPDGQVNLGTYGSVYVSGMTLMEAKDAIEEHLSEYLDSPQVAVDVYAYNSKVFYVITEGAGFGDNVVRIPITGNETVLDAISQIGGTTRLSDKNKIHIARPSPGVGCDQILQIDWEAISKGGSTLTNYQLMPGDRVYIAQDRLVAFDSFVSKVTAPFERMFGFTLLGSQTVQNLQRFPRGVSNF